MTVESDIRKTDGGEEHGHEHVGTSVPEATHDHSHTHSENDIHEEGQHDKHESTNKKGAQL